MGSLDTPFRKYGSLDEIKMCLFLKSAVQIMGGQPVHKEGRLRFAVLDLLFFLRRGRLQMRILGYDHRGSVVGYNRTLFIFWNPIFYPDLWRFGSRAIDIIPLCS